MSHFEDELKEAFRREMPPAGFAERVIARAKAEEAARAEARSSWRDWFRMPVLRFALAGALCVTIGVGVHVHQLELERARGEAAKQQLLTALHVTGSKLQAVNDRVRAISADDSY